MKKELQMRPIEQTDANGKTPTAETNIYEKRPTEQTSANGMRCLLAYMYENKLIEKSAVCVGVWGGYG